jgi:hypothetical protein
MKPLCSRVGQLREIGRPIVLLDVFLEDDDTPDFRFAITKGVQALPQAGRHVFTGWIEVAEVENRRRCSAPTYRWAASRMLDQWSNPRPTFNVTPYGCVAKFK